jgi:hypothetical protein
MTCDAFPDGIPRKILVGDDSGNRPLHDKPYKGDNGIRYEEASEEIVASRNAEYMRKWNANSDLEKPPIAKKVTITMPKV